MLLQKSFQILHSLSFHLRSFQIQIYWRVMLPFRSSLLLLVLPSGFYCFALVEKRRRKKLWLGIFNGSCLCVFVFIWENFSCRPHHSPLHFIVIFYSSTFVSFSLKSKVKTKKRTQKRLILNIQINLYYKIN